MRKYIFYLLPLGLFHIIVEYATHFYQTDILTLRLVDLVGFSPLIVFTAVQIIVALFLIWLLITKSALAKLGYVALGIILIIELSHFFESSPSSPLLKLSALALIVFGVVYWIRLIPYLRSATRNE